MEPAWILKNRAREALRNGQPEEAHRLLEVLRARGDQRAFALRGDVVRGYLDRAERFRKADDAEAAWTDLQKAEALAPADGAVKTLREHLTRLEVAAVRGLLEAGKPLESLEALTRLRERPAASAESGPLETTARDWLTALDAADRGMFEQALPLAIRLRDRLGNSAGGVIRFEDELHRRIDRYRPAQLHLQAALDGGNRQAILTAAEEVLAVAPLHAPAREARARVWAELQPETLVTRSTPQTVVAPEAVDANGFPRRFYLWIDGVGGYLVCTAARTSIGQSTEAGGCDIPLAADVSRLHASLRRDEEDYVLETTRDGILERDGKHYGPRRAVLRTGDRIRVSAYDALTFALPVPGCLTAVLTPDGESRLPAGVDAVILLADLIVIGPKSPAHVLTAEATTAVTLYRQGETIAVRTNGPLVVDGAGYQDRATVPLPGTVGADVLMFALEPA